MNINLRQDAPDQTDNVDVNELSEAIEQFKSVGAQILAVESKLKELKAQEKYISEITIPEIMEKQNLKTVKLKDGSELSVGKKFFASFKADKKEEGIQWLRDNGLGDIVDNNITVTFGQAKITRLSNTLALRGSVAMNQLNKRRFTTLDSLQ